MNIKLAYTGVGVATPRIAGLGNRWLGGVSSPGVVIDVMSEGEVLLVCEHFRQNREKKAVTLEPILCSTYGARKPPPPQGVAQLSTPLGHSIQV